MSVQKAGDWLSRERFKSRFFTEHCPLCRFVGYADMFESGRETAFGVIAPASSLALAYNRWEQPKY